MTDDGFDFDAAALVTEKLPKLTNEYDSGGGSKNFLTRDIRTSFLKIMPYNTPNWHCQWSTFACNLVGLDQDAKRPIHKHNGKMPTGPVVSKEDPVFTFDITSNPKYPDDVVIDSRQNSS